MNFLKPGPGIDLCRHIHGIIDKAMDNNIIDLRIRTER